MQPALPCPARPVDSALVLLSGGQDSVTCLLLALHEQTGIGRVEAVSFDYGQRHAVELEQAAALCMDLGVPHHVLPAPGLGGGSALTDGGDVDGVSPGDPNLPASFVPGRNALFFTMAGALAYRRGLACLVSGVCQTDYSGYPDCRAPFVRAQEHALTLALDRHIPIWTPLMHRSKAETWKLAADLGTVRGLDAFDTVRLRSHTDYNGNRDELHPWGYGSLDNAASRIRAKGYEEAVRNGWVPECGDAASLPNTLSHE
jgi:7-cyano-7-deazaguanine synthase